MYKNIGKKIKNVAFSSFILETIASIIVGIIMCIDWEILLGLAIIILGPAAAWVLSLFIFGFGEIIDKLKQIEANTAQGTPDFSNSMHGNNSSQREAEKKQSMKSRIKHSVLLKKK